MITMKNYKKMTNEEIMEFLIGECKGKDCKCRILCVNSLIMNCEHTKIKWLNKEAEELEE